jgi:hypothetical protein
MLGRAAQIELMDSTGDRSSCDVQQTLDYEMQLLREAIAMGATGAAPRIVVASIHFGAALLDPAQHIASAAGVRVVPLWRSDHAAPDLAVEPLSA